MLIILLAIIVCQIGHVETRCTNCPNDCDINDKCNNCPENCGNCTHSSIKLSCDTCKVGFYGPTCNLTCPDNCRERECNKINKFCIKGCNVGYYGSYCVEKCSTGCHDRECNQSEGVCSKGCVLGYYGDKCHFNCSHRCQGEECNNPNGFCTKGCVSGLYGDNCDRNCSIECQDMECLKDGACSKGCVSGLYGEKCDRNCSNGCQDMECNTDGTCTKGCVSGLYGDKCDGNCSIGCQDLECNEDGACSKGCDVGYHGHLCNMSCSNACRNKTCDRLDGACTHGCIEGYDDDMCHLCYNCNKEIPQPHHQMTPVMMGLGIGASILVSGAVALILLIRRRSSQRTANSRGMNSDRQYNNSNSRNPIPDAAIGNDNTIATSEARPNSVDHLYAFVQKTSQKRSNKREQYVPDGNIYDVTSTERPPGRIQRWTKTGAVITGDDTYSHISHVNKMGHFVDGQHRKVDSVYDHVTHDFDGQGIEGTYNVAMNKDQPSGTGAEMLPTPNSQDHDQDHQFARVPQYHEMYSTVSEVLPRSPKIV